ncbi:Membrane protein CcdC involved in cytochrome C biogenesis [Lentibacillus persicus]|uniref:Membrane protein CcdC involved in cytochrome C biogenesis n=1 Tax=Lentibacillus persicus TaxID=640948 RepID=A0A1I1V5W6_9BACI|nr:cytochrome c biogenesis protein CcdC [Lentibacillus persicus]SFD78417.1 Membrane protein CcdC involved in cytochrome C biogenesis [Lentibacillus persicus]
MFWLIASTIVATIMAITMIFIRLKASRKPASVKKIILPPLFMSTGAFMFLFPVFRVNILQVLEAIVIGVIFSIFLIKTSKFEVKEQHIYLIPSKAFVFILFGLLFIRTMVKLAIGSTISFGETSGMFFLLAFGMIVTWRLAMLYKFKKLEKKLEVSEDIRA